MRTPAVNPKVIATLPIFISVTLVALAAWALKLPYLTLPLGLGIIAGGLVDLDNGLSGRLKNIVFTAVLFSASSVSVQLSIGTGWPFMLVMTGLTFALTMLGVVGLRYRTLAFGTLAVACYTTQAHMPGMLWWVNPLLILLGSLLYSSTTLLLHIVFPHRPVQEGMARAFAALGDYFDAKAAFFDPDETPWLEERQLELAMKNAAVTDAFNRCRSALFYRMRGQHRHPRTARMLRYYFMAQDMHERISSSHVNYRALAEKMKNTDLIFRIQRLEELQGQACRDVAQALRQDARYEYSPRLARAIEGCRQSLRLYAQARGGAEVQTMQRLLENLFAIDHQLRHLEDAHGAEFGEASDKTRIAAQDHHGSLWRAWPVMRAQMNLQSSVFRHATRLSLVVLACCALVALTGGQRVSYWILLTALFVCQPNYSATKSRVAQRVAGTVLGVVVGSVLPWFTPSAETKLVIIVLATTLFFFAQNYKYSWSIFFVTLQAIASMSLLGIDVYAAMPQRVSDTLIGAALAWAAVYWLWPDWHYLTPARAARQAVSANGAYLRQILHQLRHGGVDDVAYRTIRRQAHEKAAALSSALSDMGGQPHKYGARLQNGLNLLKTSYALMGYISALGAYRNQMAQGGNPAFTRDFFQTAAQVADALQNMADMPDADFARANTHIAHNLRALHTLILDEPQSRILWQQLDMIARQLAPCRAMLAAADDGAAAPGASAPPPPEPAAAG